MDAFVTRKRKPSPDLANASQNDDSEQSTEIKLAILSSLYPKVDQETLLDVLLAHDGDVEATRQALKAPCLLQTPKANRSGLSSQTSLRAFAVTSSNNASPDFKRPKVLSRKGQTLHLYDPKDISEHTPCSVILNFLPAEEANALLLELLEEAKTFQRATFKLFDNVVTSPHTSCLYIGSQKELQEQKHEYVYNGEKMTDVRTLTPHLERVRARVQEAVNREIRERIRTHYGGKKLKYQAPGPWIPNAAFVNCYNGPQENVGWHSDQLTYLGPRAVIGSLSLGVTREFRVRRILPPNFDSSNIASLSSDFDPDMAGQISIHLPHNSLLVMHADMQEGWKHCIAPAQTIDPHPIAGNRRINITYRYYRSAFHPRYTPRCPPPCGVPAVLRVVTAKGKRKNWGRYFWMCHAGNVPGKENCGFFRWAQFDDDGQPVGFKDGESMTKDDQVRLNDDCVGISKGNVRREEQENG